MQNDLISRSAIKKFIQDGLNCKDPAKAFGHDAIEILTEIEYAPTVVAIEVTAAELKHLVNDTIAYIWRLEDRGANKSEFGYDSRKALLEKLKQFEKEHFPEMECVCE